MAASTTTSTSSGNRYCFDTGQFAEEAFDPAAFVTAAKEGASLEVLRDHLRGYQKDLREELYEVINRDLADYLKLSSKLSGVEHEVLEIRAPLQEMLGGLQEAREFVTAKREGLHARLAERAALQSRKETLRRRIRFLHTLADVERALRMPGAPPAPAPPAAAGTTKKQPQPQPFVFVPLGEMGAANNNSSTATATGGLDGPVMTAHCGALERLAHAWLTLAADMGAFPATEEEDDVPTAGAVGLRLQRAEKALLGHLAAAFRVVLCPPGSLVVAVAGEAGKGGEGGEGPLSVNEPALKHCLRAFLVLGRADEAERQAARLVMLPFVDLNFTQGRLDGGARGSCAGLPHIYAACLSHARRYLGAALAVAEGAALSPTTSTPNPQTPSSLDLVGNGVWRPVHQALCARLGHAVFAPGIADILHGNYTVSMQFLSDLAGLAGPGHEAAVRGRLRAHPCTRDFHARWNLPVYFHLRFTEVSARVDQALLQLLPPQVGGGSSPPEAPHGGGDGEGVGRRLSHPAFKAVWAALWGLWAPNVFLPPLTPRLVKLMLQVIGRTHHWLDEALDQAAATQTTPTGAGSGSGPFLLPPDQPEAFVAIAWDALTFSGAPAVRQLVGRVVDTVAAARRAEVEAGADGGGGGGGADGDVELQGLVEEGLREALAPFEASVARAWALLHARVVGACAAPLEAGVKGIAATYRMTNKRPPERACPYVARVLEPLRALAPEVEGRVPPSLAPVWRARVVAAVTERYLELARELLSSVQQMEDALKKRKQRTKGGGGAGAAAAEAAGGEAGAPLSDSEKIQLQLLLDAAAFAQEMGAAGGMADPLQDCAPYAQLLRAVAPARLLLSRPDVHATLPPAVDAFLSSVSASAL